MKAKKKNLEGSTHGHLVYHKDHSFKVIGAIKVNTLAPSLRHVPLKNLSYTYYSNHLNKNVTLFFK
jgi:hypothetical protein